MTARRTSTSMRWTGTTVALAVVLGLAGALYAVRANWGIRTVGPQLEREGRHEEAAFYFRTGLDFYSANARPWVEFAVYDPRADEIYRRGKEAFDVTEWIGPDHEERWDTVEAYLLDYNRDGVARNVAAGHFTAQQRARLEERCRVFTENLINPDWGWGGDFSFARKAWILERCGLFADAAFRRELAGRYAVNVCSRYYAAVAEEMTRAFADPARAGLYRERAAYWRQRALEEFRLANGGRLLSRLRPEKTPRRLERAAVASLLKQGLGFPEADARWTAARILADMGEHAQIETEIRKQDPEILKAAAGLQPGALAEYFSPPRQETPLVSRVLETVDLGLRFQANFPKLWYDDWDKPEVVPAGAEGPFRLRVAAKLYIPADGAYRFYVKTDVPSRTTMTVTAPGAAPVDVISAENAKNLLFVAQVGMEHNRIDFSRPVPLRKGFVDITIACSGDEVRKIQDKHFANISGVQRAGIQLLWSSDRHLMEPVPAAYLYH